MKRILTLIAVITSLGISSVQSQTPAPPAPAAPAAAASPFQQLQAIRDANAKLLEQQAETLKRLAEMEKEAQQLKIFAKRS